MRLVMRVWTPTNSRFFFHPQTKELITQTKRAPSKEHINETERDPCMERGISDESVDAHRVLSSSLMHTARLKLVVLAQFAVGLRAMYWRINVNSLFCLTLALSLCSVSPSLSHSVLSLPRSLTLSCLSLATSFFSISLSLFSISIFLFHSD